MTHRKKLVVVLAAVFAVAFLLGGFSVPVQAQDEESQFDVTDHEQTLDDLLEIVLSLRQRQVPDLTLFEEIAESGDPLYIAPLLDIGYFVRGGNPVNEAVMSGLQDLTGEDFGMDWQAYFEYAGREDIDLPPGYDTYKGTLLSTLIDPRFIEFFEDGVQETAEVNMVEVVWGGVAVDGIPSLVNAKQISPEEAAMQGEDLRAFCNRGMLGVDEEDCRYPAPDEYVFGVEINGDARAYPLRLLNWHEMFNDVIGSAPLYAEANADSEVLCQFRAPTVFNAFQRSGEDFVRIIGDSAGCPREGWLPIASVVWAEELNDEPMPLADVLATLPENTTDEDGTERNVVRGRVDGMPIMLAYCTLCGSGVLYNTTIPDFSYTDLNGVDIELGDTVLEFGSTGMLMRSNKLMYDRNTNTVWNALTGEPAFGALVSTDIRLEILPVVISDWATWLEQHPDTSVLSLQTGFRRDYTNGAAYSDYFNDPNFIMFPVWQQDTSEQENKDVVFGLFLGGERKAYPLSEIIPEQVTNDTLGGRDVVIVTRETPERAFFEPGGAAVRAYNSDGILFSPTDNPLQIQDEDGNIWEVTESALIGPDGEELNRLGGHLAFWFGWFAYFPDTLVYQKAG